MRQPALLSLLVTFASVIVCTVCVCLLHRWQAQILRRERGERASGFPVKPVDGGKRHAP